MPARTRTRIARRWEHPQHLSRTDRGLIDAHRIEPARARALVDGQRALGLRCVSCDEPLRAVIGAGGLRFVHRAADGPSHDPETAEHHHAVGAIARRVGQVIPSAIIRRAVRFDDPGYLADLVVLSGGGFKLVVEIQDSPMGADEYRAIIERVEDQGVSVLWLRSPRLLELRGARSRPLRKLTLGEMETAMLAQGRSLIHLAPDHADRGRAPGERIPRLVVAEPHPLALALARAGERRLGQVDVRVRRYPLSQLRFTNGQVCVLPGYDSVPVPFPAPSAALMRKAQARGLRTV